MARSTLPYLKVIERLFYASWGVLTANLERAGGPEGAKLALFYALKVPQVHQVSTRASPADPSSDRHCLQQL